jgi:hypothetical protein
MSQAFIDKVKILSAYYVEAGEPEDNTGDVAYFLKDVYQFLIVCVFITNRTIVIDKPTDDLVRGIEYAWKELCDLYVLDYDETFDGDLDSFLARANVFTYDGMGLS